jgi:hypothetical protein
MAEDPELVFSDTRNMNKKYINIRVVKESKDRMAKSSSNKEIFHPKKPPPPEQTGLN